jgi:hypothetical protein
MARKKVDVNQIIISDHAKERFIERYRKKNPYTKKSKEDIIHTMRSFINQSQYKSTWNVLARPDLYRYRGYQSANCYHYKGWVFVIGDYDEGRILLTCKRMKKEEN